ncbi:unnamed protein product, partial [Rotaria sp. Silwood2]
MWIRFMDAFWVPEFRVNDNIPNIIQKILTSIHVHGTRIHAKETFIKIFCFSQHFFIQKQGYNTINRQRIRVRMALDLILAGNHLNDKTMICKSDSIVLSCMIRKIYLSTQIQTVCSYGDVITIIHDSDYHQIRF